MTDPNSAIGFIIGVVAGISVASFYWVGKLRVRYCPKCDINWNTTDKKCLNCQTKLETAKYCPQRLHKQPSLGSEKHE